MAGGTLPTGIAARDTLSLDSMEGRSERDLIGVCLALTDRCETLSAAERALCQGVPDAPTAHVDAVRARIEQGADPLGDWFARLRSAAVRRAMGAVYTPLSMVRTMVAWVAAQGMPLRVVDPGAGSGRFVVAAGEQFPDAQLVAVEMDPLAALLLRANLTVRGLRRRTTVLVEDYRRTTLPPCDGMTTFVGNPPYVRHHDLGAMWKAWYVDAFAQEGIKASALAGLHGHFFLQTRRLARAGDVGMFVTSAEWLDVNYGAALRELCVDKLGMATLHVLHAHATAFAGTATTAAVMGFRVGETLAPVRVCAVASLSHRHAFSAGTAVPREQMRSSSRWSPFLMPAPPATDGAMELGELFRVHRGQVTGANHVWIVGEQAKALPARIKVPTITRAKELIAAGAQLHTVENLRRVVDLPVTLDGFTATEEHHIMAFLAWAREQGAHRTYIARHRKAWWSVGFKAPAPILCTYMARRPPQFTLNGCGARHINIAHGLYPRAPFPAPTLARLVAWLNQNVGTASGRSYAGGLIKFEPKEVERLRILPLSALK